MKYIIKCASFENPKKEDSQYLGTFDLVNVEDDVLINEIVVSMLGIGDCVFYYDELKEKPNACNDGGWE